MVIYQKNTGDFSLRQAGDRWREATPPTDRNRGEIMAVVGGAIMVYFFAGWWYNHRKTIGKP